jgi:hypothetical protein
LRDKNVFIRRLTDRGTGASGLISASQTEQLVESGAEAAAVVSQHSLRNRSFIRTDAAPVYDVEEHDEDLGGSRAFAGRAALDRAKLEYLIGLEVIKLRWSILCTLFL